MDKNNARVIWWCHERDLLNRDVLLQKYRMFDNLNDAFNFAIKLKDNNDVENLEIRFY